MTYALLEPRGQWASVHPPVATKTFLLLDGQTS